MQRRFRLTRSEDFKRVRRSGKSYAHPLVVLIALKSEKSDQPRVRVGVAAGRTVGTAVTRNRTKRLLREAMRTLILDIASGFDLILIARPGLASASLEETRQAVLQLLQRAKILNPVHES
ncbi:MAG: ribonuclease P protein component [Anaerolineales bacterium]|nr:ribonuclease P protein component [Anaerolineae bacterium]PWB73476.1 MAG: ribonuclease P protein component [Anaerolineales bacterium]